MLTPETPHHQLHLVTEPRRGSPDLVHAVALALDGGVDWVQLRDKSASALTLFAQAAKLLPVARRHGAALAINDRLDVALAIRAAGVHLAAQSLPVEAAVTLAGGRLLVGRSVHSLAEAVRAADDGADYVTFGHVYPTTSHPGLPPHGLSELAEIVRAVDVPVLAIGGITAENVDEILATGAAGVAVISAILSDADPSRAAAGLRAALDRSHHTPRTPFPTTTRGVSTRAAHRQSTTV